MEQEQKQKQYELAREQRYKNIMDRLKNQDYCVKLMKERHENDLETTRVSFVYSYIQNCKKKVTIINKTNFNEKSLNI